MTLPDLINPQNPLFFGIILFLFLIVIVFIIKKYQFQPWQKKNQTKINEYEEKVKTLSRDIELNVEKEKDRISKELHDSVCQELLLIKMNLEKIYTDKEMITPEVLKHAEETLNLTRSLAYELRPFELDKHTIIDLVDNLCKRICENSKLDYEFSHSNNIALLDYSRHINIFRIVQEATKNILIHSGASFFSIELFCSEKTATLMIADDGKGFEVEKLPNGKINSSGMGLIGIEQRINNFNGKFEIDSTIGKGSTLVIEIPLGDAK